MCVLVLLCRYRSAAERHVNAHSTAECKQDAKQTSLLSHILRVSGTINRKDIEKNITPFRRSISDTAAPPRGDANDWESRLLVGKAGDTGVALASSIERFGSFPMGLQGRSQRHLHDPQTVRPQPGHTIEFNMAENEQVWYGLCLSEFKEMDVLDERGEACEVQWFDWSHDTTEGGVRVGWYALTTARQPQLFECMADWGHFLDYDKDAKLFHTDDGSSDKNTNTVPRGIDWYNELIRPPPEGQKLTKEQLILGRSLYPLEKLSMADRATGLPTFPAYCSAVTKPGDCEWTAYPREFNKFPIISVEGPKFFENIRYHCKAHNKYSDVTSTLPEEWTIPHHRLRDMRYTRSFILQVQGMYVDTLSVSSVRRRVLEQWTAEALENISYLKREQSAWGFDTQEMQKATNLLLTLTDFVPSDDSLSDLLLTIFQNVIAPQMKEYDRMVCAFDGQLIRIDGTMKCASQVLMKTPAGVGDKKKGQTTTYRRVGSCVLVAVGTEGLCLTTPRLVPGENNESLGNLNRDILSMRRSVLGGLSAPAGYVTDCIRRHKNVLRSSLLDVYPELNTVWQSVEQKDEPVLWGQDIPHREWVFTRRIAGPLKQHGDYHDYVAAIKDIFNQLRLPHNSCSGIDRTPELAQKRWTDYLRSEYTDGTLDVELRKRLRTSILAGPTASEADDDFTKRALRTLGNSAIFHIPPLDNQYIPRRVLRRACQRMLMTSNEINCLFPDHGYANEDNFKHHLYGVHEFYKTRRSLARKFKSGSVISALGSPTRERSRKRRRACQDYVSPDVQGLSVLVHEEILHALEQIENETVRVCVCVCVYHVCVCACVCVCVCV